MTEDELHAQAIAEGYKDETCTRCGVLFRAHIHFVRCEASPCPMRSTTDTRSLLQMMRGRRQVTAEEVRRLAQNYADFWRMQAELSDFRRSHYETLASQFQSIARAIEKLGETK